MRKENLRNTVCTNLMAALATINNNVNEVYLTDIHTDLFFWGNEIMPDERGIQRVIVRDRNVEYPEDRYDSHPQELFIEISIGVVSAVNETTKDVHDKLINICDDIIYCIGLSRDTLNTNSIDTQLSDIGEPDITDAPHPYGEILLTLKISYTNYLWLDDEY
jgi:hypothetical protein